MTSSLWRLQISNFKAFREFSLDLGGRHALVYGLNGSGKSSLYWTLYTFLQSARKPTQGVAKYFDPASPQNLLNFYEQNETAPRIGEIAAWIKDAATGNESTYRISLGVHETAQRPEILKADLASDFVTYRFFFGFSSFRNSETFNLWPLFEKEILPFCVSTSGVVPQDSWETVSSGRPNPNRLRGAAGTRAYKKFSAQVDVFANILPGIVDAISFEAQRFYDEHFAAGDTGKIALKLGVTSPPRTTGTDSKTFRFSPPVVEFGVQIDGRPIYRPQVFLNEAKLTQLALSVRFAASLVNLHESDLKLLVLDDLLLSLDMSNRMKVVEILLSDTFASYQKIVLTHDRGFFGEFRRALGADHPDWCFLRLDGSSASGIASSNEKTALQRAEDYVRGHSLDEAALCLRKACEETAARFLAHNEVVPSGKFRALTSSLREARKKVLSEIPVNFYERVLRGTPEAHRDLLVGENDSDLDSNETLDAATKGRLKTSRRRLRKLVRDEHVDRLRQVDLIDKVLACTERVLNPAAHSGTPPLYEKEVEDALRLVKQLEATLTV